ncbi:MAG: tetratricopeptide repeat protein [Roseobacter sp.]|jgi:hypothetical protein|nr:tetratricopeptide repeat protein [Roseobacter sp.]
MSDSDSFIDEVNEEVRRDRFYFMLRRYGWVAGLLVLAIVGGVAWTEYSKAQARAAAEGLGDEILAALSETSPQARQAGLEGLESATAGAAVVVAMLTAAEAQQRGDTDAAVAALDAVAVNPDTAEIYRQIAAFKSLVLQSETMDPDTRRQQLEALAAPGATFSLLAQEQLGLMDIEAGETEVAIARFQSIMEDASVSADLQQRAIQVIVALGGTPDLQNLPTVAN